MRILSTSILIFTTSLPALAADSSAPSTTNLAAKNEKFTINGKLIFLLGINSTTWNKK